VDIFKKLDLNEYLERFSAFLSRQKPVTLTGDTRLNFDRICEFSRLEFKSPPAVAPLDDTIAKLGKFAVLHHSEIFEFSKIFGYFSYLKTLKFEKSLATYFEKILMPENVAKIATDFDENGELKESVDERFVAINQALKMKKEQIASELKKLIYSKSITPYLVDSQVHFVSGCEALLVRGGFNHALKGSVIGRSASGFFYVLPSSVERLKSQESALLDQKELVVYEYCKKTSALLQKNLPFVKFINTAFDYIDSLIARVKFAKSADLNFLLPDAKERICLCEFAHPALKNPKRISVDFTGSVLLITGVNAGGKSMLLKSLMSAALLAKHLLPMSINVARSRIGRFKDFECIIEDPQNSKNDISTFAGRMLSFGKLFGKKEILVGVDEIELGTDFEEAASLYSVLLTQLMDAGCKLVITTHHKRLAMLLAKDERVELVAALYDEANSRPKFEFLKGTIGKSYAFETALRYGISAALVERAKKAYGEDKENLNEAIGKALNLECELKTKLSDVEQKKEKLERLIENVKEQKEQAQEALTNSLLRLEREFFEAISEAKRGIKLIDVKDKQRSLNAANLLASQIKKPEFSAPEPVVLKVGDFAKYNKIRGRVVSLNKNEAVLNVDGINLRVPLKLLKRSGNVVEAPTKSVQVKVARPVSGSFVIDLHGLRAEEALEKLDKFISDSLISGFDEVVVKHGIGTGRLAFAVKEFLKNHRSVKSFADGTPNEGGFGTKIVKL